MAQQVLQLKTIEAISPTLAEALRVCKLRAGLSRAANADKYILGNPRAWLGTAYHAVLEGAGLTQVDGLEPRVRGLWEAAVHREYERARHHNLNKRFGVPESWPGYHVVAAMALIRAREFAHKEPCPRNDNHSVKLIDAIRETKMSALDGKIVGRPDLVRLGEVIDFKSGEIFEDEGQERIKGSYVRQLHIYGLLVRENLGWWPKKGILLPLIGCPVEVDLKPADCEREGAEAVRLLDEYNTAVALKNEPVDIASPSAAACRWCPFQAFCPGFWSNVEADWADDLVTGAIAGITEERASPIHNGLALSFSTRVHLGTVSPGEKVSMFPIDTSIHPDVAQLEAGDRVHVTGLLRRADNSLVAEKRTLIALDRNLPGIDTAP